MTTTRGPLQPSPLLQQDILRVLLYFDIFEHPLRAEKIYRFLPSDSTSPAEIARACQSPPLAAFVGHKRGHFFIGAASASFTEERSRREQLAEHRWRIATFMAKMIRKFPFVRAVFVSGELSKGVASKKGDIDFVIVTRANHLWICRTFLILFKKVFLLNSKKYFCLNHFVAEDYLAFDRRNIYSAIEIATLKPLVNPTLFKEYMAANAWITRFLPNWRVDPNLSGCRAVKGSRLQRFFEPFFPTHLADELDNFLMSRWQKIWRRRYAFLDDEERERLYECRKYLSTAYGEDFLRKILDAYCLRLERFGLNEDSRSRDVFSDVVEHHD